MPRRPKNVLIIKPGAIGDLLQLTPVIRALKEEYPEAAVSVLVGTRGTAALFAHNPGVRETIVFDRRGEHRSPGGFLRLFREVRRHGFDVILNFQRSNLKAWLLAAAAMPCRVHVYRKARGRVIHAVDNHLEILAPLGIDPRGRSRDLEFVPGPGAERFASGLFRAEGLDGKKVVALNPGASHAVNRWGTERFALLADRIADDGRARPVIVGGPEDEPLGRDILARSHSNPLTLAGKTDLPGLGAVLRRCAVLVSGDTGPMHMATAVGTRVVALFGAADPDRTGPVGPGHTVLKARDVSCVPCRSRTCGHERYLECMERIGVDEVFAAVAAILGDGDARR